MDDNALAKAAAKGDQEAFTTLVERYRRYIYAIAYKIALDEEDALDIAQNTLLKISQKIGLFSGRGSFRAWLATVTSREAINYTRRSNRRIEVSADPQELDAAVGDPNAWANPRRQADLAQRRALVEEAMERLSPQQRAIFALRFRDDLKPRDIAHALDLPARQVRSQLHRAIARLRDLMGGAKSDSVKREKATRETKATFKTEVKRSLENETALE